MARDDLNSNVMLYGIPLPREGEKLPQFPTPEWPPNFPCIEPKKEIKKMDDVKKFIKLLRKNINEKSGYIERKDMDSIILDTLEEMSGDE